MSVSGSISGSRPWKRRVTQPLDTIEEVPLAPFHDLWAREPGPSLNLSIWIFADRPHWIVSRETRPNSVACVIWAHSEIVGNRLEVKVNP
ncbi:hypothetical protein QFZ79_001186 [Arthrobacter sp. V4I6]|nr:hypothetical protein [Arthrobacter sp. V1I7]MDQ0853075.1 hypothetical protein [Arthrobacter sp. V4I6]